MSLKSMRLHLLLIHTVALGLGQLTGDNAAACAEDIFIIKPHVRCAEVAPALFANEEAIQLGEILMRSLRPWPRDANDQRDTIQAAKAFAVDRIVWIYENDAAFNNKVRSAGVDIGTTMINNATGLVANAGERWKSLSRDDKLQFIERFSSRNIEGEQVLMSHIRRHGGEYWISHWMTDQTNPQWLEYYTDYVASLYAAGISTLHRDGPHQNSLSIRAGGNFTDAAVLYFRNYLKQELSEDELQQLGVVDIDNFNVREHFLELGAPTDGELFSWTGSRLMPHFIRAMAIADNEFLVNLRKAVEKKTGISIPWSSNELGPIKEYEDAFDFRIGEFPSHFNQPQTLFTMGNYATAAGKRQAWISMVDRNFAERADFTADLRRHIATAYAIGTIPLVPWCVYMGAGLPRYYGKEENYADLFHFVADNSHHFNEYEQLVSVSGIDMLSRIYSWLPNRELTYDKSLPEARVWLNHDNTFAFARRASSEHKVVIHLVDWNSEPAGLEVTFNPMALVGTDTADVRLIRPNSGPVDFPEYAGESITIGALDPWGILVVEANHQSSEKLVAPFVAAPSASVIPRNSVLSFNRPGEGYTLYARLVSVQERGRVDDFKAISELNPLSVANAGIVEAYIENDSDGRKSDLMRIPFKTYDNFSLSSKELEALGERPGIDLSERFALSSGSSGEMKINESFHTAELSLMNQRVERGFSTRGDAVLVTKTDSNWRYFVVEVGIDDAEYRRPCARFQVLFDNALAYETPIINPSKMVLAESERRVFRIALRIPENTKNIQLSVHNGGFFVDHNTFIWAEPRVFL
jgi:hypothetical protein